MKKRIFAVLTVLCLVVTMFVAFVIPVSAATFNYNGVFDGFCGSLLTANYNDSSSYNYGGTYSAQGITLGYVSSPDYNFSVTAVISSSAPLTNVYMYFSAAGYGSGRKNLTNFDGTNIYFLTFTGSEWMNMAAGLSPDYGSFYFQNSENKSGTFNVSFGIISTPDFYSYIDDYLTPDPVVNDSGLGVLNNLSSVQISLSDADDLPDREVSLPLIRSTFGGFALRPAEYNSDFYQYNSAVYDFNFSEPFDFLSFPFYVTGQSYEMTATVFDVDGNQYAAHFALDDPSVRRGTLLLNNSSVSLPYLMTDHIQIEFSNPEDYAFGQYILADGSQASFHAGYTSGYNDGNADGYLIGYAEGQLHPTDDVLLAYTESVRDDIAFEAFERGKQQGIATKVDFPGLIFAVVDTPIQVISNVLNFDIFGYNMSYFFFGLLTLALFAALLRRIL